MWCSFIYIRMQWKSRTQVNPISNKKCTETPYDRRLLFHTPNKTALNSTFIYMYCISTITEKNKNILSLWKIHFQMTKLTIIRQKLTKSAICHLKINLRGHLNLWKNKLSALVDLQKQKFDTELKHSFRFWCSKKPKTDPIWKVQVLKSQLIMLNNVRQTATLNGLKWSQTVSRKS